jgi:hypothetical protein
MKKNPYGYSEQVCDCCGQAKTYLLPVDYGTALIVKAVAAYVRHKGINVVHPTKEMEVPAREWSPTRAVREGVLTSTQIGNFTRARVHGLIAKYRQEPGNWVLTSKGARFLKGERIPKLAIVEKTKKGDASHKQDYHMPDDFNVTIHELTDPRSDEPMWNGIDFDILEGRIILESDLKPRSMQPTLM